MGKGVLSIVDVGEEAFGGLAAGIVGTVLGYPLVLPPFSALLPPLSYSRPFFPRCLPSLTVLHSPQLLISPCHFTRLPLEIYRHCHRRLSPSQLLLPTVTTSAHYHHSCRPLHRLAITMLHHHSRPPTSVPPLHRHRHCNCYAPSPRISSRRGSRRVPSRGVIGEHFHTSSGPRASARFTRASSHR
jgi:hypothetical protein